MPMTMASATAGMFVQRVLDHPRIDVVAAADDQILDPVGDEQIPVGVQVADIAGAQRAVDEGVAGLLPRGSGSPS